MTRCSTQKANEFINFIRRYTGKKLQLTTTLADKIQHLPQNLKIVSPAKLKEPIVRYYKLYSHRAKSIQKLNKAAFITNQLVLRSWA